MRRIKHAEVQRLALCKRGKNGLTTLYKSDGTAEFATLTKGGDKGQLLSVMWPKGLEDADGDFADTDRALLSMSSSLIANGGKLDIEHDGKVLPRDAAYITEVFTIQDGDERFADWRDYDGNQVDVSGGIAVAIQIDDPELRAAYRDGDWDGVSLFGPAAVEQVDTKAASQRVAARMGGVQQKDMTKEEMQAAMDAMEQRFTAKLAELTKSVAEPKDEKVEPKGENLRPTFTGDVNDPEALEAYEKALRAFEFSEKVASGNMSADDIASMRKSMAESGPTLDELNEAGITATAEDSREVRELQTKLFKARKRSNVPAKDAQRVDDAAELAKSAEAEGLALGALLNQHMGSADPSSGGMKVVG